MNEADIIRVLALRSVVKKDSAYNLRKIFKYYSKTYSTALERVYELPLEEVIRVYHEDMYENMSEEEIEQEIRELTLTDDERKRLIGQEEMEEIERAQFAVQAEELQKKKNLKKMEELKPETKAVIVPNLPKEMPENVSIRFLAPDEFEQELERFEINDPTNKKR